MSPRQRGFLSLVAVAIIVVLGFFAVALSYLYLANVGGGGLHTSSAQALFLAESGLERATKRYAGGTACSTAALAETQNLGDPSQTFSVVSAALVNGLCRIRVTGSTGNAMRTIEGDVSTGGFVEPFAYANNAQFDAVWSETIPWPWWAQGSSGYDPSNNCPVTICSLTTLGSGSFVARTTAGNGSAFVGFRSRNLPTPVAGGTVVTLSVAFAKTATKNSIADTYIYLYDSVNGCWNQLWYDGSFVKPTSPPPWQTAVTTTALPAGCSFDQIEIWYVLQGQGNNPAQTWFDEIRLNSGSSTKITAWREIAP